MGNLGVTQIDSAKVQQKKEQKMQQENATQKAQEKSVSFFDEAWSGYQIAKLTGDNFFTDWLQDKDKVCTDGKDDGKLSFKDGAVSFAKGLVGGIPKAIINHPLATGITVGLGAAAVALTGGAILPVLTAAGIIAGVGMIGYGTYKAATSDNDGDAKRALETMGMGVTTTALSVASVESSLEKAAEAGVKSAQVSENANIVDKTIQVFKSIPESLKLSYKNSKFKLGFYVEGAYRKCSTESYLNEILLEEKTPGGVVRKYTRGRRAFLKDESILVYEKYANGTTRKYEAVNGPFSNYNILTEEKFADGSYKIYGHEHRPLFGRRYNTISKEGFAEGGYRTYNRGGSLREVFKPVSKTNKESHGIFPPFDGRNPFDGSRQKILIGESKDNYSHTYTGKYSR